MSLLENLEAIRQLKYRYFRLLDSKRWVELGACFTDDATAAYDSGKYSYTGRDAILEFLRTSLGSHDILSLHQGHHPEITLIDVERARGTWYLEDYLIFRSAGMRLRGAAFYDDDYVCHDGVWRIAHTGYVRTFEEMQNAGGPWQLTRGGAHLEPLAKD